MTDNPYTDLFNDEPFDVVAPEAAMPNKARGDDPDLPERLRAVVDEVAAEAGREASEYEVWHNDEQVLVFIPATFPKPLPNSAIDLGAWPDGPYDAVEAAAANARAMGAGWCAPTEAERWQWLTDDERAAEIAEARAAADRHGDDYIAVGGMTMPHPPMDIGGFIPLPIAADGLIDLPAVSIDRDTEAFQASMAEARARIGDLAAGLAAAFDAVNIGLGPALAALGQALDDRDGILPIVGADTALIALDYAERTKIINHPDKQTRRRAKKHYLEVRRHLPREHRRRLKSVPMNQFGALS